MRYYGKFKRINAKNVTPSGWHKRFLETQKAGLTGNIEKAGFPFNALGWDNFKTRFGSEDEKKYVWTSYEQTAYALDGQIKCAVLLKDKEWTEKIAGKIERALCEIDSDGYIGPKELKDPSTINRWPHVVFFRAVQTYYDYTDDKSVVKKISDHYLKKPVDYAYGRNALNVEIMLWAYEKTGAPELLDLAEKTFKTFDFNEGDDFSRKKLLSRKKPASHGVSFNETVKLGALLYEYTGKKEYLTPIIRGYKKVFRYQMLPDGLHSCNENMSDRDYMQTHELCDVTDFSRAMNILVEATGKGEYADRAERCVYNAGLGAVDKDFKSIQYFSGLNQIIADDHSNRTWYKRGSSWNAYRPNHITPCCTGNCNRFMADFLLASFMKTEDGIAAVHYGSFVCNEKIDGKKVRIREKTFYPFDDIVRFEVKSETPFAFSVRIPSWSVNPSFTVNGENQKIAAKNGFAKIDLKNGVSEVVLTLPSEAKFMSYCGGTYVEKGCVLFALAAGEKREISQEDNGIQTQYPKWNIYAASPWNYAINTSEKIKVIKKRNTLTPWQTGRAPVLLEVSANRVNDWKTRTLGKIKTADVPDKKDELTKTGKFVFTPRFPQNSENISQKTEKIRLTPFAATTMRVSVFPVLKNTPRDK